MTNNVYEKFLDPNIFCPLEEIVNSYGQSAKLNFSNSLIIIDEKVFNMYKNEDLITINVRNQESKISKKLIHDILSDEGMYKYLQTNLDNPLAIAARLDYVIDASSYATIKITRAELIEAFKVMYEEFSQKEKTRVAFIKNTLLQFSCEQRYKNYIHHCFIEGESISIPGELLLNILTMSDENFQKLLDGTSDYGYKKEYLAYALVDFIERERIFKKYVFNDAVYERYESIANFSVIDFESINKNQIPTSADEYGERIVDKIEINESLQEQLDSEKKNTYSNLELAIYYYIKLCELLTYDKESFFSTVEKVKSSHESIENINSISPNNNEVITYDFVMLYAKILSNLGILYTIDQTLIAGINQGSSKLTFKEGEYLVSLNSLENLSSNDLVNVKVNDSIANLTSTNKHEITKKKFNELVDRIYKEIIETRENKKKYEDALEGYKAIYASPKISIKERMYLLLKEICRINLKGIDMVSYATKIFMNLFKNEENISLNFVCTKTDAGVVPLTLISILDGSEYIYYVINPSTKEMVECMKQDELNYLLESETIYYIGSKNIPGIDESVGEVYAR